jgi:act minimal PKS chain-length factor (CLF/KS beta)
MAQVEHREVDLVVSGANGSPDLDRLEAAAIEHLFGIYEVPVTSPAGTIGSWMASGALRLATGIAVMHRGEIYPTLLASGEVDPTLRLPGLVVKRRAAGVRTVLGYSFACGGGNVALLLQRGGGE